MKLRRRTRHEQLGSYLASHSNQGASPRHVRVLSIDEVLELDRQRVREDRATTVRVVDEVHRDA